MLLLAAGWLLLGPRGGLRREVEAWLADHRRGRVAAARWDALVAAPSVLGGPSGRAIVVVFTDYRCPWCAAAHDAVERALAERPDARVVVRHLPVAGLHPDAPLLARVSVCAEGDPAWPAVHRGLYAAPTGTGAPSRPLLRGLLGDAGVARPDAVLACADGPAAYRRVERDVALARALGVVATPTFVAPGRVVVGALSAAALLEMLGPS